MRPRAKPGSLCKIPLATSVSSSHQAVISTRRQSLGICDYMSQLRRNFEGPCMIRASRLAYCWLRRRYVFISRASPGDRHSSMVGDLPRFPSSRSSLTFLGKYEVICTWYSQLEIDDSAERGESWKLKVNINIKYQPTVRCCRSLGRSNVSTNPSPASTSVSIYLLQQN